MRIKKRLALAGSASLILVVVAALLVTAGPATAEGTASLRILEGTVRVLSSGEEVEGRDGQTLGEGDVVITGIDGRAEISYFDGSITRLDRETSFAVAEVQRVEDDGRRIAGSHDGGRTFSRVVKLTGSETRFEMATPTATASVRGTTFDMRHAQDGSSEVWVLAGAVLVEGGDERPVTVSAFQGVRVDPDGTTNEPFALSQWQLHDPWLRLNLCELDRHAMCHPDLGPSMPRAGARVTASSSGGGDMVLGTTVTRDEVDAAQPDPSSGGGGKGTGGNGTSGKPTKFRGGGGSNEEEDDGGDVDPIPPDRGDLELICATAEDILKEDIPPPC